MLRLKITVIYKVIRKATNLISLGYKWIHDLMFCSYSREHVVIRPLSVDVVIPDTDDILPSEVLNLYQRNHFDVLGSGWRDWTVQNGANSINVSNRNYAKKLFRLISVGYVPIDWHCDIRAGYSWPARRWSRFIQPGRPSGVDIKLPWELSRMQHHVLLAMTALDKPALRVERARMFRDQVLDFMANNPPRYGVNWRTAMDVAIRAANWIITYSLFRAAGEDFDAEFDDALGASLIDHGRFIVEFMEWNPLCRGNHYLANQCGLAIIATALPGSLETDAWFAFAVQELNCEVLRQIRPDGSVFEASTGYHRLSLEMVVYATAVVLGSVDRHGAHRLRVYDANQVAFKKPLQPASISTYPLPGYEEIYTPFTPVYFHRLAAAACFVRDITMNDGRVPLIGDNDSGFFVRSRFTGDLISWDQSRSKYANLQQVPAVEGIPCCPMEDKRNMGYLQGLVAGLIDDNSLYETARNWSLEFRLVRALSGGLSAVVTLPEPVSFLSGKERCSLPSHARVLSIELPADACDALQSHAYTDFGLYLFRSPRVFVAVRCGPIGQEGFGGHAHNDQLSVVLQIDGRDLISDPGVYRYTVDAEERRRYRSVQAHFAPRVVECEPGDLTLGPWRLGDEAKAEPEYFDTRCFQGAHQGYSKPVHRRVWFDKNRLYVADWGDGGLQVEDPALLFERLNLDGALLPFCPAYGVQLA